MKKKSKTAAIKHARNTVSPLSRFGDGHQFSSWSYTVRVWRQGHSEQYFQAQANRAQAMIDAACTFLDCDPVEYQGGSWEDYIPAAPRKTTRSA